MYALFIVLNEVDYLEDILTAFVEVGVKGATILDSQGMGSALMNNGNLQAPLLGALKIFLNSSHPYNKTIFTVIESESLVEKAVDAVNDIMCNIGKPGIGLMFTVPVAKIYPIKQKPLQE